MKYSTTIILDKPVDVYTCNTVVVGSGASAFSAINRLHDFGQEDIFMVTEGLQSGTSRNTGSDKQTYYKLTLCGDGSDSIEHMAKTYFAGECMDGDIALCEAAYSSRCFYYLCEAGVPFPHNEYGEYPGYQTDHDAFLRATSAGPLTSKFMTECLQKRAEQAQIPILDGYRVIAILTTGDCCVGILTISKKTTDYMIVQATNVVYATGGPAGIYAESVYPTSQAGGTGVALEAGAIAKNLTEWQYGIASTKFRWNLSGTYQQVLPRYISTNQDFSDEREFLSDYFSDETKLLENVFLKGYQWPFDPRKIEDDGSSMIDMLVFHEKIEKNRRVFLDFTQNPKALGKNPDFSKLGKESYQYLEKSKALFGMPIDRLAHMNRKAIQLYQSHGIDLSSEWLEISVCAQHNNGGLAGNIFWESNLKHFFPIGEVNGSHGVYRPGGSALNAGQVGALRATQHIAKNYTKQPADQHAFLAQVKDQVEQKIAFGEGFLLQSGTGLAIGSVRKKLGSIMSRYCAHNRSLRNVEAAKLELKELYKAFMMQVTLKNIYEKSITYYVEDHFIVANALVAAIEDYLKQGGQSRGSYFIASEQQGSLENTGPDFSTMIQEIRFVKGAYLIQWRQVRPIPTRDLWFENVWKEYQDYDNN